MFFFFKEADITIIIIKTGRRDTRIYENGKSHENINEYRQINNLDWFTMCYVYVMCMFIIFKLF